MRLLTARLSPINIGVFWRAPDNDKFWLQDLYEKDMYVSEECMLFDRQCDQFKLLLEGHPLCKVERKNRGYCILPRKPVVLTSNFVPWIYAKQQAPAILERLYYFNWLNCKVVDVDFDLLYSCSNEDLYAIHMYLFE